METNEHGFYAAKTFTISLDLTITKVSVLGPTLLNVEKSEIVSQSARMSAIVFGSTGGSEDDKFWSDKAKNMKIEK